MLIIMDTKWFTKRQNIEIVHKTRLHPNLLTDWHDTLVGISPRTTQPITTNHHCRRQSERLFFLSGVYSEFIPPIMPRITRDLLLLKRCCFFFQGWLTILGITRVSKTGHWSCKTESWIQACLKCLLQLMPGPKSLKWEYDFFGGWLHWTELSKWFIAQWKHLHIKQQLEKVALDGSVECCAPPPRWCDLDRWPFDPKT